MVDSKVELGAQDDLERAERTGQHESTMQSITGKYINRAVASEPACLGRAVGKLVLFNPSCRGRVVRQSAQRRVVEYTR